MRKNHQPFWFYMLKRGLNRFYIQRFIKPQFDTIGKGLSILSPRSLVLFGSHIHAGKHLHIISDKNNPVSLSCWSSKQAQGEIHIGDYVLISPGVKIASASCITIEDDCMIASEVYISDCDWHGTYNRTRPFRCSANVHIKKNAWVGYRAIIGKGITIGCNSIVAAGSVVIEDVPDNCIVGGNPAKIIKHLDPSRRMIMRNFLFNSDIDYNNNETELNKYMLIENSTIKWLRSMYSPKQVD